MAELLHDSSLVAAIEKLIDDADDFLWLVSPYISLHQRIKDKLRTLARAKPAVEIIVVFGKNEEDAAKSLSNNDVAFLKELPNIQLCYEKRLHAKMYASEDAVIVTSMNLHQYSVQNNIEIGLKFKSLKWLKGSTDTDEKLLDYIETIIDNSQELYKKTPQIKTGLLGFSQKVSASVVELDETENFFKQKDFIGKTHKEFKKPIAWKKKETPVVEPIISTGYCIRTGKPIPFNPNKPLSAEAYKSWSQFKNPDFKEKYCRKTGKPSNGKTSVRNPVMVA